MRKQKISEKLLKVLSKLQKKDKTRFIITLKKINEVMNSPDLNHYKNLSNDMKYFKRVHIDSHFLLLFKIEGDVIKFEDLQHHDTAYKI